MTRVYDNWERLVAAVLKREELRQIALSQSFSSSISADFSSRFSFDSSLEDVSASRISSETISLEAPSSPSILSYHDVQPMEFEEIIKATENFRHDMIFEEGAFGTVFKGWIDEHTLTASKPGSGMAVAVKKWNPEGHLGHEEWSKELNYLSQLRHPNLVKLVGYCAEEDNMILVYEFMPKGSLDNHLFRRGHQSLSWATRIKVAIGAARGLSFLHDKENPVIHRDFKTANILLDGEFNAKLCHFGLARDGPTGDMTHVSTRVMYTYGYAAPEYIATGHLTAKCDVYGFGVVLLELLCGRRVIERTRVMDTKLEGQFPINGAYSVATITLQCLSPEPKRRPRMADVLVALEQL